MSHESTPNGSVPPAKPTSTLPGMRLVFFGLSIVSDWDNPAATNHRAMLRALAMRGHQVAFLEERRNAPTVGLLKQRGAAPLKAFDRSFPDIPYRTYEISSRRELDVWLGIEAATASAIVALDGTPKICLDGLERLDPSLTLRLVERASSDPTTGHVTALHSMTTQALSMPYAPAVHLEELRSTDRNIEILLVAYDDRELAHAAAAALPDATMLSAGTAMFDHVAYVPEVELPAWYRRAGIVVIVDRIGPMIDPARALLPVAHGSSVILVVPHETQNEKWPFVTSTAEHLPLACAQAEQRLSGSLLAGTLERFSAMARAAQLEQLVFDYQSASQARRPGPVHHT